MEGYHRVREELHNRILKLRSIENLISKPIFERLWKDSSKEEATIAEIHIGIINVDGLIRWMRTHRSLDIGEKSLRELQKIAKSRLIKNWSRLTKRELIIQIAREEK